MTFAVFRAALVHSLGLGPARDWGGAARHAAAVEVVFLQHPISDDPYDQLLLQIQGATAEYERAVLGERFRRGKMQRARSGHYLGGRAPYGYRY